MAVSVAWNSPAICEAPHVSVIVTMHRVSGLRGHVMQGSAEAVQRRRGAQCTQAGRRLYRGGAVRSVLSKLAQAGKQARCPRMVLHVTLVVGERLFALTPQPLQVQGIPSCNAQACTARRTRQLHQQQHSCNSPAAAFASSNPFLASFRLWGVYFCLRGKRGAGNGGGTRSTVLVANRAPSH